ncbi:MAG: YgiT-type zinc finger protein [Nitrospirota bacterium]
MDRLEDKEEAIRLFEKYPVCRGEVVEKEVEKLLKGGKNTAVVKVTAEVCLHCGERLYSHDTIIRFEKIRKKLQDDVEEFVPIGKTFEVA